MFSCICLLKVFVKQIHSLVNLLETTVQLSNLYKRPGGVFSYFTLSRFDKCEPAAVFYSWLTGVEPDAVI